MIFSVILMEQKTICESIQQTDAPSRLLVDHATIGAYLGHPKAT
jgi:hypothetical protein